MVMHVCNSSTGEAKAAGLPCVQNHPGLQGEFKDSLNHIARPVLKKNKLPKTKNPKTQITPPKERSSKEQKT